MDAGTLQAGAGCWFWFWPHHTKARKDGGHTLHTELGPGEGVSPEGSAQQEEERLQEYTVHLTFTHTHRQHTHSFSDAEYPGLGKGRGYRSEPQKQPMSGT